LDGKRRAWSIKEALNLPPGSHPNLMGDTYFTSFCENMDLDQEKRVLKIYDKFKTRSF
jgi:hypothetical protein